MTRSRQTADWGSRAGLAKVIPSSVAVGSGTGSANFLGTVTFSGVSSVSLNNVFSSTYDNYRIIFFCDTNTTSDTNTNIRLRANGTDLSSAVYAISGNGFDSNNVAANSAGEDQTSFTLGGAGVQGSFSLDIFSPFRAYKTLILALSVKNYGTNNLESKAVTGMINNTTAYDGFTIYPSGGSMTGSVSIYGYTQ